MPVKGIAPHYESEIEYSTHTVIPAQQGRLLHMTTAYHAMHTFIPAPQGTFLLLDIDPPSSQASAEGPVAAPLGIIAQGLAATHPASPHPPHPLLHTACIAQQSFLMMS